MSVDKLPGYQKAIELGYVLNNYSGNYNSASYVKHTEDNTIIHLTIRSDETADLQGIIGMVTLSINRFSFPHQSFDKFEKQINRILTKFQ